MLDATEGVESISEGSPDTTSQSQGLTRREFIKGMLAGAALGATSGIPKLDAKSPKQTDKKAVVTPPKYSNVSYIELQETPSDKVLFLDLGEFSVDAMVNSFITEIDFTNEDERTSAERLLRIALESRVGHGENMIDVYMDWLQNFGYEVSEQPTLVSINDAFTNVQFSNDRLGNPEISFEIDENIVGNLVENYFRENDDAECINLSFQIGKSSLKQILKQVTPLRPTNEFEIYDEQMDTFFYTVAEDITTWMRFEGRYYPHRTINGEYVPLAQEELLTQEQFEQYNREHQERVIQNFEQTGSEEGLEETNRTEVLEMYNPKYASENLRKLIALCNRFPNKSFNVSGGNINSFFFEIRQELEQNDEWPENLLIHAGEPDKSDGSDIYVQSHRNSEGSIIPYSSSASSSIISTIESVLASRGLSAPERRTTIEGYCTPIQFETKQGTSREALSIDFVRLREGIALGEA